MRGAYRILTVRGIPIKLHWTFLAFFLFAIGLNTAQEGPAEAAWWALIIALLFAFVTLHELAHAVVAQRYGLAVREIILLPVGGIAQLERIPENPRQEAAIAIAGPAFNFVVGAALFAFIYWLPGIEFDVLNAGNNPDMFTRGTVYLFQVNVMLALFNLLPAFPMDGGRLLRAALVASGQPYARATSSAVVVSKVLLVMLGIAAVAYRNPMLAAIAVVLWISATGEETFVRARAAVRGLNAGHLLPQRPVGVEPETTLGELLPLLLSSEQRDFPVIVRGRLAGVVCHADLVGALRADGGSETPVARLMRPPHAVAPDDSLAAVAARLDAHHASVACILRNGKLLGLVSRATLHRIAGLLDGA